MEEEEEEREQEEEEEKEAEDKGAGKEPDAAVEEREPLRPLTRTVFDAHARALPTFPLDIFATMLAYAGYVRGPYPATLAQELRVSPSSADAIAALSSKDFSYATGGVAWWQSR